MNSLPHWDLSSIYPRLESPELAMDMANIEHQLDRLEQLLVICATASGAEAAAYLGESIERVNGLLKVVHTVGRYLYAFVATDSHNMVALKKHSEFHQLYAQVQTLQTQWQAWVGQLGPALDLAIAQDPRVQAHAFILRETAHQAQYLMSAAEESLATELGLSGAVTWMKLYDTITSQLTVEFDLDGKLQKLPMPALINLRNHSDAEIRRRAYLAEHQAYESIREPLAAALNGVKGSDITLNRRRGWDSALHVALDAARIDQSTLDAMISAVEASFPLFRRYLKAKAKHLGKEQLAWWDLFAPLGQYGKSYSWDETRTLVVESFANFSSELASFAEYAIDQHWLDVEPREGKVGNGFCMALPGVQESRILLNFDGSLYQVSAVAHELGHAFHNHRIYQAEKSLMQSKTPATLAETASVMCETLVMEALLEQAQDAQEELAVLERSLNNAALLILVVHAAYRFEHAVYERRAQAELSADDFCAIMEQAQKHTYGDGLNEQYLFKYMWCWLPHFYRTDISFYNFPYAFGLLFSTGLYAIYQQRGAEFVPEYQQLLASTGDANAADLAARFGIDLHSRKFWDDSLAVIERHVDRFCALCREVTETAASTQIEMRK